MTIRPNNEPLFIFSQCKFSEAAPVFSLGLFVGGHYPPLLGEDVT